MSRADRRARRHAERLAWLKANARVCVVCGVQANDDGGYLTPVDGGPDDEVYACPAHEGDDAAVDQARAALAAVTGVTAVTAVTEEEEPP
jgi:hypothetical protein